MNPIPAKAPTHRAPALAAAAVVVMEAASPPRSAACLGCSGLAAPVT